MRRLALLSLQFALNINILFDFFDDWGVKDFSSDYMSQQKYLVTCKLNIKMINLSKIHILILDFTIIVWKLLRNFTVTSSEKIFREIKFIVVYYVTIKTLLSRNFCQKSVRKNFLLIVTSSTILSQKFSQSNIFIKELFSSWFDKKYFALQQ